MSNATIKDIAIESGVSIATVSRVLNKKGYFSHEVNRRVSDAVEKLNYQPNGVARSLKSERTNTIGVIIPDISNPYFMNIAKGIEDTVSKYNYNIIFCSGDEDSKKESKMLQILFEKRVDAIVLATSGNNEIVIKNISESGLPIVLVDRTIEDKNISLDMVLENNVEAAYSITKHLIQQGHKHIGVVNGLLNVSTGFERYKGFRKAIEEFGIEENPTLVYSGKFTQSDGVKAVKYFSESLIDPTVILSFNNTMTFGVILELIRRGYRIPEDIAVASYGDIEATQLLKSSGIISISQSPYKMGVSVGGILLKRLINDIRSDSIQKIFNPSLTV